MQSSVVFNSDNTMKIFLKNGLCEDIIKRTVKKYTNNIEFKDDLFPFVANGIAIYGKCVSIIIAYDSEDNKNNIIKALEEKDYIIKGCC